MFGEPSRKSTNERGDSHGEESSQGREEEGGKEGGEEAVTPRTRRKGGAVAPFFHVRRTAGNRPRPRYWRGGGATGVIDTPSQIRTR